MTVAQTNVVTRKAYHALHQVKRGFDWIMKDDQVAAVLTYIRNSWGSASPPVEAGAVGKQRSKLANRTD